MAAIPKEIQQWLTDDWNGRAYAAGIREISIIVSQNVLGQIATQQYARQTVAQPDQYALVPVTYESLEQAKAGAAKRCATHRVLV